MNQCSDWGSFFTFSTSKVLHTVSTYWSVHTSIAGLSILEAGSLLGGVSHHSLGHGVCRGASPQVRGSQTDGDCEAHRGYCMWFIYHLSQVLSGLTSPYVKHKMMKMTLIVVLNIVFLVFMQFADWPLTFTHFLSSILLQWWSCVWEQTEFEKSCWLHTDNGWPMAIICSLMLNSSMHPPTVKLASQRNYDNWM